MGTAGVQVPLRARISIASAEHDEHRPSNRLAVALGKIEALSAWAETGDPPYSVWRRVERWVLGLDDTPRQWPSAPLTMATGDL
jgi:hypothetical protein